MTSEFTRKRYYTPITAPLGSWSSKTVALTAARNLGLELHNEHRKFHDAPPLKLNQNLCQQAEIYAATLANDTSPISLKESEGVARNIYRIQNYTAKTEARDPAQVIREAVASWYSYNSQYNWKAPLAGSLMTKQFSQMVWKASREFGIGVATGGEGGKNLTVVVALYSPAGNYGSNQTYFNNVGRLRVTRKVY